MRPLRKECEQKVTEGTKKMKGGFENADYPAMTFIVRREHFDDDLAVVNSGLGIDGVSPGAFNETRYDASFRVREGYFGTHPTAELLAERVALTPDNLLNNPTRQLIGLIYAVDYARLPYDAPA
jgi:hypothetical protein